MLAAASLSFPATTACGTVHGSSIICKGYVGIFGDCVIFIGNENANYYLVVRVCGDIPPVMENQMDKKMQNQNWKQGYGAQ